MRLAVLVLLGLGFLLIPGPAVNDLPIYAFYADRMAGGELPYADFGFEYPPLAAPLLALGGVLGSGYDTYQWVFGALMFLTACAVVLLIERLAAQSGGDRRVALAGAAVALLLCGSLVRTRFDLAPVALTLGALVLLCARRPAAGMAVLGAAVLTKGFPVVVAPVALAWLIARGERRQALRGAAAFAAVLAVGVGLALAISPGGFKDSLRYHLDRPAQVESSPAAVLTALDALGAGAARTEHSFGSAGVRHPASGLVLAAFAGLLAAAVALAAGAVTVRRPPDARGLVLASLAAVVAFAALGKVLSPQFLIWIAPLTALAAAWRAYALAGALLVAHVLTSIEYPSLYGEIARGDHWAVAVVGVRNAVLVAAIVLALRELVRAPARAPARSRWPGRLRRPRPAPR